MNAINQWLQQLNFEWVLQELFIILAALLAVTVHESAHALTAYWLGDDTAKRMGRISLNPLHHVDIVGLLMMAIVHFGWAKPVQIDMRRFKNPKLGMALSSLAGPVSNVLTAAVAVFLQALCVGFIRTQGDVADWLATLFYCITMINAGFAVFNLIPIPPLDGSKVLAIILPQKAYFWLMRYERYGMILLIVLLFSNVLDKPLQFLREGLIYALQTIAIPVARLIVNVFH